MCVNALLISSENNNKYSRVTAVYLSFLNKWHARTRRRLGKTVDIIDTSLETAKQSARIQKLNEEMGSVGVANRPALNSRAFDDLTDIQNESWALHRSFSASTHIHPQNRNTKLTLTMAPRIASSHLWTSPGINLLCTERRIRVRRLSTHGRPSAASVAGASVNSNVFVKLITGGVSFRSSSIIST